MPRQLRRDEYTVGWVCALPVELAAAQEMLDEVHETPQSSARDTNIYTCGRVSGHNVVIACLPEGQLGIGSAATVAAQMSVAFTSTRIGLMVGIGGGVPSRQADIRLGDVVVSFPHKGHGGVVQYDFGKTTPSGFERTGFLNPLPTVLLNAVANLRAKHLRGERTLSQYLSEFDDLPKFIREAAGPDILFDATYNHEGGATCGQCDRSYVVAREPRKQEVEVHYGTIASGNQVMRSAAERDKVSAEFGGVLCFEMEAAGLMNNFPCLVIRGICDYADSHKNKTWQPYAAATAAACAKEVLSVISPAEAKPTYYLRFPKNRYFVGRRRELHMLQQKLIENQDCQKMCIVGLGGTGKTQLALQFAYTIKERWPEYSIFWVPTVSIELFEQACIDIAKELCIPYADSGEEDVKELVKQYLSSSRVGRWLLVVDNADDPDIVFGSKQFKGIVEYLPESEKGVVVYTTRNPEIAELTRGDVIELEAMDQQDAADFLTKSLTNKNLLRDDAMTTQLLDELTCLPLAIAQAAAYLNRNRMSIKKYLSLLQSTEQLDDIVDLMSGEFHDDMRYKESANAVATTWALSFSQIRERDVAAANLLEFISCVEWKAIPRSLLPRVQPEGQMEKTIGTLCGYSLLTRQGDNHDGGGKDGNWEAEKQEEWFDIHRLVHLATRIWVSKHGDAAKVTKEAVQHVTKVFPSDDHENGAVWRAYLPHALRLLESDLGRNIKENSKRNIKAKPKCNIKEKSKLCLLIGRCLRVDGRFSEAVTLLETSCQWRDGLAEDDSDRLLSQYALAIAYQADGQVKRAVGLLEHVVAMHEKVFTDEPCRWKDTLEEGDLNQLLSQHALATAYQADGQMKKAVELLEHVVAQQEKVLSEEHPSRLESQHHLACVRRDSGVYSKALEELERVYEHRKKILGKDHPNTLETLHAIATVLELQGKYKEALERHDLVLEGQKKSLGDGHYSTLDTMDSIASIQERLGQYDAALETCREALKGLEDIFGERDHPSIAGVHSGIADILLRQAKYDEAESTYKQAHASFKRLDIGVRGEFPTATNIARVLRDKGQYQDALKWCEIARKGLKELGEDNEHMLAVKFCIAHITELRGLYSEALRMSQDLCEAYEKKYGKNHTETFKIRCRLGSVFNCLGRYEEALEQFGQALSGLTTAIGADHDQTLVAVQGRADVLEQLGEYDQVLQLCKQIQKARGDILGEEHPQTLMAIYRSGSAFIKKGENATGLEVIQRAMDGWERVFGKTHPYIYMCFEDIGNVYKDQGEYDLAIDSYEHAMEGYHQMLGDEHPWAYRAQVSLATVIDARNPAQHDKAEHLCSAAIMGLETTLGTAHPWTIVATTYKNKAFPKTKVSNRVQRFLVFLGWCIFRLWIFGMWVFAVCIFGILLELIL